MQVEGLLLLGAPQGGGSVGSCGINNLVGTVDVGYRIPRLNLQKAKQLFSPLPSKSTENNLIEYIASSAYWEEKRD